MLLWLVWAGAFEDAVVTLRLEETEEQSETTCACARTC
uniref:Uncharacterized protein n=1 Tax=Anguilla anguilla TaxID=7936 RepID=A0A0E9VYI4_ANGAN